MSNNPQDKAAQDLAAYIRSHPEVFAMLPKDKSKELQALCRKVVATKGVNVALLRSCVAVVEHRHRASHTVTNGNSFITVPLAVDEDWFKESCVGIHSVRVVDVELKDGSALLVKMPLPISFAKLVQRGHRTIESGDPRVGILSRMLRLFACNESNDGDTLHTILTKSAQLRPSGWL